MTVVNVTVKWRNQEFKDVELNICEPLILFKTQLWQLTNVPPEKQKLMYKGLLKDDVELSNLSIKNNDRIMLIGSAEILAEKPANTVFIEDLSKEERGKLTQKHNITFEEQGIVNLGNTCYLNSILQFLYSSKDLMEYLKKAKVKAVSAAVPNVKLSRKVLLERLIHFSKNFGKSIDPFTPDTLVYALRECFPQFSSTYASTKEYMQQDAEECMNALFTVLNEDSDCKIVDNVFSFKIVNKIRRLTEKEIEEMEQNNETKKEITEIKRQKKDHEENKRTENKKNTEAEQVEMSEEFHTKLCCHMGNQRHPINHMHEGIKLSFKETIEKFSEEHGKNMLYEKISEIDSLPPYLIVHFVRFEWIKIVEGNKTISDRAKICRKVNFSQIFDLYDFCSEKIKNELKISRNIILKRKEKEVLEASKQVESLKEENKKKEKEEEKKDNKEDEPKKIELFTGNYKLLSVVTHKGRYAEGGHYIAWRGLNEEDSIEENKNHDMVNNLESDHGFKRKRKLHDPTWLKLDDDKVSSHKFSQIDLTGGRSDYHIAVLLMFKRESIFCTQEEIDEASK